MVSIKKTLIVDGQLFYKDIENIWSGYDKNFHNWILKLTEEFDLTFPAKNKEMSIVPCLLPERESIIEWPDISNNQQYTKLKELKVIYSFSYIPAGLFNRIQVRLYEYGDSSTIWKNGSLLKKNNHIALLSQKTKNSTIELKVQGIKPENIVFVIHEAIETLINESFSGIKYDYSFPCPDCVESKSNDPCLFSSTLLRRATELKAPFLQCHKYFHVVSIQEMRAIMPFDGVASLDLNLEYSLRDLKQMKANLKYDITFWYCHNDSPSLFANSENKTDLIDPIKAIEDIKKEKYKVWYSKNPKDEKMDKITYAIKESKLIILGISDQFLNDEKSIQIFELVKNIVRKNYLIVEFGINGSHNWLESPIFASVCSDYRIIMQDPKRYEYKISDALDFIERQLKGFKVDKQIEEKEPEVFISYCWQNSHDAFKKGTKTTSTSLGNFSIKFYFK